MASNWAGMTIADLSAKEQLPFLQAVIQNPDETKILQGVAGSGKTLVAAFALLEISKDKNKKCELLVYTKLLKEYIKQNIPKYPNDKDFVKHFHHPLYYTGTFKNINVAFKDIYIVDEAQDLQEQWFEDIKRKSKSQIWIGDGQQRLYKEVISFEGKVESIPASARFFFSVNYRNALPQAKLAANFITLTENEKQEGKTLEQKKNDFISSMLTVNKNRGNERKVRFIKATSEQEQYDAIVETIKSLQNSAVSGSKRIAIAHFKHGIVDKIETQLKRKGFQYYRRFSNKWEEEPLKGKDLRYYRKVSNKSEEESVQGDYGNPNFNDEKLIIVSPIHSLKGLEFDYVFFPHADGEDWGDSSVRDNLLFVLFTRAKNELFISYVDKEKTYVWQKIKDQKAIDYIEEIDASEILDSDSSSNVDIDSDTSLI